MSAHPVQIRAATIDRRTAHGICLIVSPLVFRRFTLDGPVPGRQAAATVPRSVGHGEFVTNTVSHRST